MRDRVEELGNLSLEVNVVEASAGTGTGTGAESGAASTSGINNNTGNNNTTGGRAVGPTIAIGLANGSVAYPEYDDSEPDDEYFSLAEKDKPLSARVLCPSDDEMADFYFPAQAHSVPEANQPNTTNTNTNTTTTTTIVVDDASHLTASPAPVQLDDRGRVQFERVQLEAATVEGSPVVNRTRTRSAVRVEKSVGGVKKKKVPIGTRLTMTSRAGFFQDRIVSPSMVRFSL
jgi:hypothetical protein